MLVQHSYERKPVPGTAHVLLAVLMHSSWALFLPTTCFTISLLCAHLFVKSEGMVHAYDACTCCGRAGQKTSSDSYTLHASPQIATTYHLPPTRFDDSRVGAPTTAVADVGAGRTYTL